MQNGVFFLTSQLSTEYTKNGPGEKKVFNRHSHVWQHWALKSWVADSDETHGLVYWEGGYFYQPSLLTVIWLSLGGLDSHDSLSSGGWTFLSQFCLAQFCDLKPVKGGLNRRAWQRMIMDKRVTEGCCFFQACSQRVGPQDIKGQCWTDEESDGENESEQFLYGIQVKFLVYPACHRPQ